MRASWIPLRYCCLQWTTCRRFNDKNTSCASSIVSYARLSIRGVTTHVMMAQRRAVLFLKNAPAIVSDRLKYGKTRELLEIFRAYNADDEASVNLSLDLLQYIANELQHKYAIRKKTCKYSRARFLYHFLFWRPLLQNWKNAILKRRNVPHPLKMRDFIQQIALKLPGFDCSEGLLTIISVLTMQQTNPVSAATLCTQTLEQFLDFLNTHNCKKPDARVYHAVLLAWSQVLTVNGTDHAVVLQKYQYILALMEKHHVRPHAAIYNVFLQYYRDQKDQQAFQQRLSELIRDNVRPDYDTIDLVSSTLEKDHPFRQQFLHYIAVLQDPDDVDEQEETISDDPKLNHDQDTDFSKMLQSEKTIHSAIESDKDADKWTLSTCLLEALQVAIVTDREKARRIVDFAQIDWGRRIARKEIHHKLDDEFCIIMTEVYKLAIEHVYGDELKQILERDPSSCAVLMKAYAELGDFESAHDILFRLLTYEKLSNNLIFNILLEIWAQSKAPYAFERATQVIEKLEDHGLRANRATYHALLQIHTNTQ